MTTCDLHLGTVGFEKQAQAYDNARPSYPHAVLHDVLASLPATPTRVLDVAAGTGIFTRLLTLLLDTRVTTVDALEPVEAMRAQLLATTTSSSGVANVFDGTAQHMPMIGDATYDVVFVVQAFHWFATLDALRELRRVLKRGGSLVLVWNMESGWTSQLRAIYEQYDGDVPQYRKGAWRDVWLTAEAQQLFGPLLQREYEHEQRRTREQIHQLVGSKSYVAKHDGLIEQLGPQIDAVLDNEFGVGSGTALAPLAVPYSTNSYTAIAL